jgi:hypothetical protein
MPSFRRGNYFPLWGVWEIAALYLPTKCVHFQKIVIEVKAKPQMRYMDLWLERLGQSGGE